jgi:hypothetical protein
MRATREYLNLPHVACLDSERDAVVPPARIELSLGTYFVEGVIGALARPYRSTIALG